MKRNVRQYAPACKILLWLIVWELMLFGGHGAQADELQQVMDGLDLSAWQGALDEADLEWNASEILHELVSGDGQSVMDTFLNAVRQALIDEVQSMSTLMGKLIAPALLWAVARLILGEGRTSGAAGWVCYLTGACIMLGSFREELRRAQQAAGNIGALTGQVFPVLTALMSASGRAGTAGLMGTLVTFGGGTLIALVQRVMAVLVGGAG